MMSAQEQSNDFKSSSTVLFCKITYAPVQSQMTSDYLPLGLNTISDMACLKPEHQAHDTPPFLCVTRDAMLHSPSWVGIKQTPRQKKKRAPIFQNNFIPTQISLPQGTKSRHTTSSHLSSLVKFTGPFASGHMGDLGYKWMNLKKQQISKYLAIITIIIRNGQQLLLIAVLLEKRTLIQISVAFSAWSKVAPFLGSDCSRYV